MPTNIKTLPADDRVKRGWRDIGRTLRPAFALLAFAWLCASGAPASAAPDSAKTYFAIGKPVCAPPGHPFQARCFALRRVLVPLGTAGAKAFRVSGGATGQDTQGPSGGLTPSDIATAYNLPTTGGAGQTVAVIDAFNDPNIEADLATFDAQYGLPDCTVANGCLTIVGQTGTSTLPANDAVGWSVEETLDVETVRAACQGCKILVVETNSQSLNDLSQANNVAVQLGATEISNSWGYPERQATAADVAAFKHPGVVITASTGDDGYFDYDFLGQDTPSPYNQTNFPAALSTVIAVGGTSLYLGQGGLRQSETVWNDNGVKDYDETIASQYFGTAPLGGTGGGCSVKFFAAQWQIALRTWSQTGCGNKRLAADVSAVGDYLTGLDIYDSYTCSSGCVTSAGWLTVGGTSLASPLIASVYALAGGAQGVPYPALTLYGHYGKTYDVTVGGNGWCDGEGAGGCGNPNTQGYGVVDCDYPAAGTTPTVGDRACDALPGYDGPSGVGTPNGLTAFTKTGPVAPIFGAGSVVAGTAGNWASTPSDPFPGGKVTSYAWTFGDGSTATTTTNAVNHTYAAPGTFTLSLTVTDQYGVSGASTSFAVMVSPTTMARE